MASKSADRISSLPDNVRSHILKFLPLRDAAKSSILSSKWRYLWTNLPTLLIDKSFGDDTQSQLRFRCPLLTTLILDSCYGYLTYPCIVVEEAPILECLYLVGRFSSLVLNATSFLKTVTFHNMDVSLWQGQLSEGFHTVETLSIGTGNFCEYITPTESWVKLRQLNLFQVRLSTRDNVLSAVRVIMNSPNLQRLAILMEETRRRRFRALEEAESGDDDDSKYEGRSRLLRKVQVKKMTGRDNEMILISWLLKSSPALEEMEIQLSTNLSVAEKMLVVIKLNRLERASSKAQIIVN